MLEIFRIPLLQDNYSYIINDVYSSKTACIDPGMAEPILLELEKKKLKLDFILNTHHHHDHVGGNLEIQKKTMCKIYGPHAEKTKIPGINLGLKVGVVYKLGSLEYKIIETPGHTSGHICYYFFKNNILFSGDTLFSLGCGRVFEGTASEMWKSLKKIRELPDETTVYCGHEYTESNTNFATFIDSENVMLKEKKKQVLNLRKANQPTVPFNLGEDKLLNPFLRVDEGDLSEKLNLSLNKPAEVFAKIRKMKDNF